MKNGVFWVVTPCGWKYKTDKHTMLNYICAICGLFVDIVVKSYCIPCSSLSGHWFFQINPYFQLHYDLEIDTPFNMSQYRVYAKT
jgi:hypothetical protein